jgi:DNA polymerase-1
MKALIDAEYYLYRAAAGAQIETEWDTDVWTYVCRHDDAKEAFQDAMADFIKATPDHDPVLVFSSGLSFRYSVWPDYKGNRKDLRRPAGYRQLTQWVSDVADGRGWKVEILRDVEGDDVLGILYEEGDVIVSTDKDMLTLPGRHYRDGGFLEISRREADLAFYCQALVGDRSDHYPGCPTYGPVKATELLAGAMTELEMWSRVVRAYEKKGFSERYAVAKARCARILRAGEYDHDRGVPLLWNPPVT